MPNWARYALYGLGVLGVALVVWGFVLAGWYVLNFLLVLAFIAVFAGLIWLRVYVNDMLWARWLVNLAMLILVGWVVLDWVGPAVVTRVSRSWPYSAAALGRKKVESDLKSSEVSDAVALNARVGTVEYCRAKERMDGIRLSRELEELLERRRAGIFADADRTREAKAFVRLRDIAEERRICQEQIRKIDGDQDKVSGGSTPGAGVTGALMDTLVAYPSWPLWVGGFVATVILLSLLRGTRPVAPPQPPPPPAQPAAVQQPLSQPGAGSRVGRMVYGMLWILFLAALLGVGAWLIFGSGRHLVADAFGPEQEVIQLQGVGVWVPVKRDPYFTTVCTDISRVRAGTGRARFGDGTEEPLYDRANYGKTIVAYWGEGKVVRRFAPCDWSRGGSGSSSS